MKFTYNLEQINDFINRYGNMSGYSVDITDYGPKKEQIVGLFSEDTMIVIIMSGKINADIGYADLSEVMFYIIEDIKQSNFHLGQISKASEIKDVLYLNRDYDN